jgi:hypothetical protein
MKTVLWSLNGILEPQTLSLVQNPNKKKCKTRDLLQVEAVDLDPVVISAAREAMGFPADRWEALCAWLEGCRGSLFRGRHQMLTSYADVLC